MQSHGNGSTIPPKGDVSAYWARPKSILSGVTCFPHIFTLTPDHAFAAIGFARFTGIAAMEDQQVMGVFSPFSWNLLHQPILHLSHVLARCQTRTVGNTEDMRIDCNHVVSKCSVEDHVRRFSAHSGEGFQGLTVFRNPAGMLATESGAGLDDVLCLGWR